MLRRFEDFKRITLFPVRRLGSSRSGSTLVEFALIAFPLLLLLLATFEVGFIYWANQELENATGDAARMVRTGQVKSANMNQAQLKTQICSRTALLVDCQSRLRIDVRSATAFNTITPPEPLTGGGQMKADNAFSFSPGNSSDAVLVTAFYDWKSLFSGVYIVRAATPARNEPF